QRTQTEHVFCETCPQRGERVATEKNHRDRCAAQRLYRDGDSAARPDLRKSRCLERGRRYDRSDPKDGGRLADRTERPGRGFLEGGWTPVVKIGETIIIGGELFVHYRLG